jgi:hypothetical protein
MNVIRVVMTAEHWYCHKLHLPGSRWVCDRYDAWVMGGTTWPPKAVERQGT